MTAQEKFEARVKELGLEKDYAIDGHIGKVLDDGSIVVLVHMECENDDPFTEIHYPPFEELWKNPEFRDECKKEFYVNAGDYEFIANLAQWLDVHTSWFKCPLFPVDLYWLPGGFETEWFNYEDDPVVEMCGRTWAEIVGPFEPDPKKDWLVGKFTEGELWINNEDGAMVLVKPDGKCFLTTI